MRLFKVFYWGLIVSFLGSLPLGTMNVAAMQIGLQESIHNAILFALGSITMEMIYVRVSLVAIIWIRKQKKLFRRMEWVALGIMLALAIGSFWAAMHPHQGKNVMLNNHIHRYILGFMLSAINPVQIPFWFGWSAVLFSKNILIAKRSVYNIYIIGIGLGSMLANLIFIFGGKAIVRQLGANQTLMNWIIGGIFAFTALIFLIKILMNKDGAVKVKNM